MADTMPNTEFRMHIYAPGDMSAGIMPHSEHITLVWPHFYDDPDERERLRTIFTEAFSEMIGDKVGVTFHDECITCNGTGTHNKGCPDADMPLEV